MGNGGSLHPYGSKHRQDLKSWKKVGFLNNQVGTEFLMKVVNRACVRYLWREKLQRKGKGIAMSDPLGNREDWRLHTKNKNNGQVAGCGKKAGPLNHFYTRPYVGPSLILNENGPSLLNEDGPSFLSTKKGQKSLKPKTSYTEKFPAEPFTEYINTEVGFVEELRTAISFDFEDEARGMFAREGVEDQIPSVNSNHKVNATTALIMVRSVAELIVEAGKLGKAGKVHKIS